MSDMKNTSIFPSEELSDEALDASMQNAVTCVCAAPCGISEEALTAL